MKKTIICNWGSSGQGKSQSIVLTRDLIVNAFPNAPRQEFEVPNDIKEIITIGDIKIGIESQGDPNSRLTLEQLTDFIDCHIILCASRTRGETVSTVIDFANAHSYHLFWVTNHRENNSSDEDLNRVLNQLSAQSFWELIQLVMNGL